MTLENLKQKFILCVDLKEFLKLFSHYSAPYLHVQEEKVMLCC